MSCERYRYFKGESQCPFSDGTQRTFWEWERMYSQGFEEVENEQCWEDMAADLVDRYRAGELPSDARVDRIMSYPQKTVMVFCYVAAMKGKWFPYDVDSWEMEY